MFKASVMIGGRLDWNWEGMGFGRDRWFRFLLMSAFRLHKTPAECLELGWKADIDGLSGVVHECLNCTSIFPANSQNPNIHEAWTEEPVAHTGLTAEVLRFA
jgi:hypothetical protein